MLGAKTPSNTEKLKETNAAPQTWPHCTLLGCMICPMSKLGLKHWLSLKNTFEDANVSAEEVYVAKLHSNIKKTKQI